METCSTIPAEPRSQGDVLPAVLRLAHGSVRTIDPAAARVVRCITGTLWLTQEGNPADVVLGAGERFVAARRGKIVVQALSDAATWTA
jgi:hypothetical protein